MKSLLLILLLSACHHTGPLRGSGEVAPAPGIFDTPFKPEFYRPNAVIVPLVVETEAQMDLLCGGPTGPRHKRLACARIPVGAADPCVIVVYANASDETLDHEVAHCIYGRYHP